MFLILVAGLLAGLALMLAAYAWSWEYRVGESVGTASGVVEPGKG